MKRVLTSILALAMVLSCYSGVAFAASAGDVRASLTLRGYSAGLSAGGSRGAVSISYDVKASKLADTVGVTTVKIYKTDGSCVATINGSTSNGLIQTDSIIHKGTYSYTLTSGVSYYAEVTVFARVGSEYDSHVITTSTVKAP